jgi:hypothetical protein
MYGNIHGILKNILTRSWSCSSDFQFHTLIILHVNFLCVLSLCCPGFFVYSAPPSLFYSPKNKKIVLNYISVMKGQTLLILRKNCQQRRQPINQCFGSGLA